MKTTFASNPAPVIPPRPSVMEGQKLRADLPVSSNSGGGIEISAEAQYLFEMDKFLSELDQTAQRSALDYLSQSRDPLQQRASDYFRQSQETLDRFRREHSSEQLLDVIESSRKSRSSLLDKEFELNGSTEIAVMPMGAKVFRLDDNENYYPVKLDYRNDALNHQLNSIEKPTKEVLGNQDAANLIGAVRNAVGASENIFLSFDDVFHFNYTVDKARVAIGFIDAPESIGSALNELLDQSVAYQNDKQTRFLSETKSFLNDSRVSQIASEDVRLGAAAQLYNNQLQNTLKSTSLPILEARDAITQLLTQHTDLVRFDQDKISEAFTFYQQDFENFERALNKEFNVPAKSGESRIDNALLHVGRNHAASAIEGIKRHLWG